MCIAGGPKRKVRHFRIRTVASGVEVVDGRLAGAVYPDAAAAVAAVTAEEASGGQCMPVPAEYEAMLGEIRTHAGAVPQPPVQHGAGGFKEYPADKIAADVAALNAEMDEMRSLSRQAFAEGVPPESLLPEFRLVERPRNGAKALVASDWRELLELSDVDTTRGGSTVADTLRD